MATPTTRSDLTKIVKKDNVATTLNRALDAGAGLLRLTPTWVPRSFLHPGKRIKLAPTDWYAYGAHRGGIDERWFGSATEAANENRNPDEGLSYVACEGQRFTLRDAMSEDAALQEGVRGEPVRSVQPCAGDLTGGEHVISEPLKPEHFEKYADLPPGEYLDKPDAE